MTLPVRFADVAEAELNEAAEFYDIQSPGLGGEFVDEVERVATLIGENPLAAPAARGHLHKRVLMKFPYALIYSVREDEVRVLAVAHHRRRPYYWRGRS